MVCARTRRAWRCDAVGPIALALALAAAATAAGPARAQPDRPSIAVLPFRVHSAKPIDYLGESLANLIDARLGASFEVQLVEATRVRERLAAEAVDETDEQALRRLAREMGADYVVSGSLTELAGRYSLDVRLTPAAAGVPGRTRVLTAEHDDELLGRVNELADRVLDQILGAAPSQVVRVDLRGAGELEPDLRARLATRAGDPYDPVAIRDDLEALRRDVAGVSAEADTESGPEGVVVIFRVVTAEQIMPPSSEESAGSMVADVRVRGNRRIEANAILSRLATQPGTPYNPAVVAKDLRQINALGFFRDIRVYTEREQAGLIVTFEVEENPVVRQISISGNENIEGDEIRDVLTLTTGSTLDYPLLFENRVRVQALYLAKGYYLADVSYEIEPLSTASVGIHFVVEENDKLKLRRIVFEGNEYFSDGELREDFNTKPWRFWSLATSWFDNSGTYSEPLFHQDLRGILGRYANAGFIRVEMIDSPQVKISPEGLEVRVRIKEGPRFHVRKIDVSGDTTVDKERLRELLQLKEGEVFNRSHLNDDMAVLTSHYQDRGFFYASVEPLNRMSDVEQVVDITYQIRKGPLYFIRQIDISGNTQTVDSVIRREVPVVEGQLYSQRRIHMARDRVRRLGFFEEVDLRMEPTQEPEQLDLELAVVEKPTGSFSFGAGFSSQDDFVLNGSLSQANLFGRGYNISLSGDFSTGGGSQRFFLSFTDPAVLGSEFSLGATIFNTSIRFEDFDQDQVGADLVLGHALTEDNRIHGFLRYSFSFRDINESSNVNAAGVIFRELLEDRLTSSSLGVSFVADYRNDRISPNSGFQLGGSMEYAGLGFFTNFLRFEGRGAWYLGAPRWLPERSTFVLATRLGYAIPFNSISDFDIPDLSPTDEAILVLNDQARALSDIDTSIELPLSERYFLGGLGQFTLRGFKARSVGPRRPILRPTSESAAAFAPVGRNLLTGECVDTPEQDPSGREGGNGNGKCNDIDDTKISEFEDLKETDVIGGNKFISTSFEYRFPISEAIGLQGILFLDMGNAFAEGDNLLNVDEWRYGSGGAIQWFSPFGPLMLVLGFPLDPLSNEKSPVFEFSVGGGGF